MAAILNIIIDPVTLLLFIGRSVRLGLRGQFVVLQRCRPAGIGLLRNIHGRIDTSAGRGVYDIGKLFIAQTGNAMFIPEILYSVFAIVHKTVLVEPFD